MSRFQTRYLCQSCGYESPKWMGRCPECESWDSFVEEVTIKEKAGAGRAASAAGVARGRFTLATAAAPVPISDVEPLPMQRLSSGIGEFDRVLGGGFVRGGLVLVGGDPGIGKSTLLTQVAAAIASGRTAEQGNRGTGEQANRSSHPSYPSHRSHQPEHPTPNTQRLTSEYLSGSPVLYISGEESAQQIKLRCSRLGAETSPFMVSAETDVNLIIAQIEATRPALAIVDSIQTVSDADMESAPGSVSQVRACAAALTRFAKSAGVPIVLIGHVTKEGNLAGPRVLEHIVDTVLYFEGDRHHAYRLLRAVKNRFGSTDELGIFAMHETGLAGVENPSAALLAERSEGGTGSAVTSTLEGSRALLVEVQALVARSALASPRRAVTGMDPNRVSMVLAVLEKRVGLKIADQDVWVNVAGGVRIVEPAADLATAVAIASNFREQAVEPHTILLGEVGLGGEVRAVSQVEKRLREAARLGFKKAVISKHNAAGLPKLPDIKVVGVVNVNDAIHASLLPPPRE